MQMPKPVMGRFEINFNTILQIVTLVMLLGGGVAAWVNATRDIDELAGSLKSYQEEMRRWIATHEQLHKDRLADVKAVEARTEERFRNIEGEIRKIGNLEYRMTVAEQSTMNIGETVKTLQETVNRQGSDIRLALEILQRMEARNGGSASSFAIR